MKDLLPIEAYELADRGFWRTALVMTVLWGVPMTALMLVAGGRVLGVLPVIAVGMAGALAFGMLWTSSFRKSMRKMTRRIHGGDPALVPPPPEGRHDYRLACSHLSSPLMAVGGHLYTAPDALTFVPHRKNLKRHQAPLAFPAGPELQFETFDAELPRFQRLFVQSPMRRLRITGPDVDAVIATPEPDEVAARLRRYYRPALDAPPAGQG